MLVEVTYLIQARMGHFSMRRFIQEMKQSPLQFEHVAKTDIPRIHSLFDQYSNLELDFVDASIVAISERLNATRILTVDRRDFTIIRPKHCDHFELLP